jgi:hypothetical protein
MLLLALALTLLPARPLGLTLLPLFVESLPALLILRPLVPPLAVRIAPVLALALAEATAAAAIFPPVAVAALAALASVASVASVAAFAAVAWVASVASVAAEAWVASVSSVAALVPLTLPAAHATLAVVEGFAVAVE